MDPFVHFMKANTEFLLPFILPTSNFTSNFTPSFISNMTINLLHNDDWVNLSKIGGKGAVFRGLAGLLQGISQGQSTREILRSSPASPRKTPSFPTLLLRFTFYFQNGFSNYWGQQASKFFFNAISLFFWWQIANSDTTFYLCRIFLW